MECNSRYYINRDVLCRIEEPEGAILLNMETDAIKILNSTGLLLWQALEAPLRKKELVEHLLLMCEDAPAVQAVRDVNDFVDELKADGFIGELIE